MPLFEVPYEMPFIAITERAFAMLVNEQYAVLERGAQVHERLERLVIEGRGLEAILGSVASAIGGSAIVQDATGRELARHPSKGGPGAAALKALGAEVAARRATSALTPFEPAALVADRARAGGPGARAARRLPRRLADRGQPAGAPG